MKKTIQLLLIFLSLKTFGQEQKNYSDEFLRYFDKRSITLKSDSILFDELGSELVTIPQYIPKNKKVKFGTKKGSSITIRQVNYTDIEFEIINNDEIFKGNASLSPNFHLGMETVGFSDGEYIITYYYITEADNSCIYSIGLGNQNIAKESSEDVYALVSLLDGCEGKLNEIKDVKLRKDGK